MELSTEQRNKWRIYDSMQQLIGNEMKATCLSDCKNIHGKCFDLHPFSMKDMQNLLPLDMKLFHIVLRMMPMIKSWYASTQ